MKHSDKALMTMCEMVIGFSWYGFTRRSLLFGLHDLKENFTLCAPEGEVYSLCSRRRSLLFVLHDLKEKFTLWATWLEGEVYSLCSRRRTLLFVLHDLKAATHLSLLLPSVSSELVAIAHPSIAINMNIT